MKKSKEVIHRFSLYEKAVQSPDIHLELFLGFWKRLRPKTPPPLRLREDFCGSFAFSTKWVTSHPKRTALGIDLDKEVLQFGMERHLTTLNRDQLKRLDLKCVDVRTKSKKQDLIVACNFSFCVFKTRKDLKDYFKSVFASLDAGGVFMLEHAGGPGMIEATKETRKVRWNRKESFTYIWDQLSYCPVTAHATYMIRFKGKKPFQFKEAFFYDWRLWSLPEIKECLEESGFKKVVIFWEKEHRGRGTGTYFQARTAPNDYAWVVYIGALK
jgi:cyclopropane fatty-acyl-phospholipid synthase-like methyltransferase